MTFSKGNNDKWSSSSELEEVVERLLTRIIESIWESDSTYKLLISKNKVDLS